MLYMTDTFSEIQNCHCDVQFIPRYLTDSVAKEVWQIFECTFYTSKKSFVMVQVRTNLKAMCLSVYGVKLWNTLPDEIKNCTSVNIFKKCLKQHFLSHYYTNVRSPNSVIFVRFMFPTKSMHHIRQGLRCNIIE